MPNLRDKTALVTGASRGIGRASARALAAAGAHVIVHFGNAEAEAESLISEIRAGGGNADIAGGDLAAMDGPAELAAQVRRIAGGQLDIFVANAGISGAAPIAEQTTEKFDQLFAVNVRAPYFWCRNYYRCLTKVPV